MCKRYAAREKRSWLVMEFSYRGLGVELAKILTFSKLLIKYETVVLINGGVGIDWKHRKAIVRTIAKDSRSFCNC